VANERLTTRSVTVDARAGVWVSVEGPSSSEPAYEALWDATERALADEGLGIADAVRSRLTAATRTGRSIGSQVRLRRLALPFPVATSSYIDAARFDGDDGALLETLALVDARSDKQTVENRPSPPPWKVVVTGELAFVTGASSVLASLDEQLDDIRDRLAERLGVGAGLAGSPLRPIGGAVYVERGVDLEGLGDVAARVGLAGLRLEIARCDGFASPESRLEVEVDAVGEVGPRG
jgi:hypothetical protein